jgi:putative phage-type endonuclease
MNHLNSRLTNWVNFIDLDEDQLKQLAEEMAQFGLVNAALYKSITVEKNPVQEMEVDNSYVLKDDLKQLFTLDSTVAQDFVVLDICKDIYEKDVVCSVDDAVNVFLSTTGQSKSREWFKARKNRISASRAHSIVNARKKETCLKYFFESSFDSENLRYGRETEPIAKTAYQNLTLNEVIESGLVIKSQKPWLCASPDAIVKDRSGELIILEIKCPSSCKNKPIRVPYISDNDLKKSHPYYTQVQVQMFCCNLKQAHFFVFSDLDFKLITVKRDDDFL